MSSNIDYKGARFYKCALQVNSCYYGKIYHGIEQNEDEYNRQILEQCRDNDISVVGLADHGNVENSKSLRVYLSDNDIVVFPGFEITSSEKIHMVCLYPEYTTGDQLNQFLGQLMGENSPQLSETPTHPSSLSCQDIAEKILSHQEGFWYAAHITGKNGLLRLSGDGDNYVHLWKKEDLVIAAQISSSVEDLSVESNYRAIIDNENRDYKREKEIAFINAKDVYKPEQLSEPSASCKIKMTKPTFQAFRDAFKDPQSRIRLNCETESRPPSIIESIHWRGAGLFDRQELVFSDNLNAVIGGRGTGKSTLIESIRFVLGLKTRDNGDNSAYNIQSHNLTDSEVKIKVRCSSQHGERYTISRRYGDQPVVKNENGDISHMTPQYLLPEIELLGQNEILKIEQNETDKLALLNKFLPDIQIFSDRINEAKQKLSKNRKKIIDARKELDDLEQKINREGRLREQQQQYKKLGVEEKLKDSALLTKESHIIERVDDQLNRIEEWFDQYENIFDLHFLQDDTIKDLPNRGVISEIRGILEQSKTSLDNLLQRARQVLENTKSGYQSKQTDWKAKSDKIRDQINQAIARLPDRAGKSGREVGQNYQKIIAELTGMERYKEEYEKWKKLVATLESQRTLSAGRVS